MLQLLAVTAEPLRFFTRSGRGTSPVTDPVRQWLAPLVEFAYLNHGYFFFAPEPGPSHLVEFRFENDKGRSAHLRIPDRHAQWPRLLYHRHFMLTENLNQLWVPPVDPALAPQDPLAIDWSRDRARYELIRDSMRQHVATRYDAQSEVQVDRIRHELPSIDDVLVRRLRLNDRQFYVTLPDAPLAELEAGPLGPPVPSNLPLGPGPDPSGPGLDPGGGLPGEEIRP